MHSLGQNVRKILQVENVKIAPRGYLANSVRVPMLANVAVLALDKYAAFAHVFDVHFTAHVRQTNSLANMPASPFNNDIAIRV